jgi:hypothetical protein
MFFTARGGSRLFKHPPNRQTNCTVRPRNILPLYTLSAGLFLMADRSAPTFAYFNVFVFTAGEFRNDLSRPVDVLEEET